jgi:hypothetical protein
MKNLKNLKQISTNIKRFKHITNIEKANREIAKKIDVTSKQMWRTKYRKNGKIK